MRGTEVGRGAGWKNPQHRQGVRKRHSHGALPRDRVCRGSDAGGMADAQGGRLPTTRDERITIHWDALAYSMIRATFTATSRVEHPGKRRAPDVMQSGRISDWPKAYAVG